MKLLKNGTNEVLSGSEEQIFTGGTGEWTARSEEVAVDKKCIIPEFVVFVF